MTDRDPFRFITLSSFRLPFSSFCSRPECVQSAYRAVATSVERRTPASVWEWDLDARKTLFWERQRTRARDTRAGGDTRC